MTLEDFLLARIAEDEAEARAVPASWLYVDPTPVGLHMADVGPGHVLASSPARVLNECRVKRMIMQEHASGGSPGWHYCEVCHDYLRHDAAAWPCDTLRLLALPYASHPDYLEEWKP